MLMSSSKDHVQGWVLGEERNNRGDCGHRSFRLQHHKQRAVERETWLLL